MAVRAVDDCPHRGPAAGTTAANSQTAGCRLALQVAGQPQVPQAICQACCNFPTPELPELNPALASHLVSSALATGASNQTTVRQRWAQQQLLAFGQARLAGGDGGPAPNATYFGSGRARALRSCAKTSNDYRAARAAPLQKDDYFGSEISGIGRASFRFPRRRSSTPVGPRIGLVGGNSRYGLGQVNRDLASQLGVQWWLAPKPGVASLWGAPQQRVPDRWAPRGSPAAELSHWLTDVDMVLFVEQPPFPGLIEAATNRGLLLACVPNWEWLHPGLPWLAAIDVMLCPTRHTAELLSQWQARFGFAYRVRYLPWPIDVSRFAFRPRRTFRRCVTLAGSGGYPARRLDDPRVVIRRKGVQLVIEAARRLPACQFILCTTQSLPRLPSNIRQLGYVSDAMHIYGHGDVCLQPSYWEGIGLPLLECQAAGLPLITVDVPPANEYAAWQLLPSRGEFLGELLPGHVIPLPELHVDELVDVLQRVLGRDLRQASRSAREFIWAHHAWPNALPQWQQALREAMDDHDR